MFTAYKEGNKSRGNNGGGSNKNRRRNNGGGNDNTSNNNNEPTKYCWTHGLCFHSGVQCNFCSTKHQLDATATDKRGGSQAGF
jgi:hypothetical protein